MEGGKQQAKINSASMLADALSLRHSTTTEGLISDAVK
jgi:hypothetical protein